ncbi:MAG: DNA-binding protein [Omnitrophica bacterium RIFCSPLOWO2_12_FULL_44_17]|uniref:DNA-binding protein n=1 Tax=Candidatus Danuiimicrobium aquiferis TaxID=1801832 RepID=A0A1G1L1M4_9BACT|nr:MAG: DNA-binding protein [Omnitrophica bacterium RIFCSPHIGHO2_02_FULL_45_28]OGW91982.1 MAG: DNA-binding protein [Omnitrophica bacterium RIFCSPHIGHO2_12_FULL_44_12]OGW99055.1 MAG: DNA-binding protein [Omnitrophica bacterium RIFCSPLOWO2_12_FULL_44_17]OGX04130.1 MAG: DNA-binding protein [Omnitrophica bacterium RIFCSPLOWO2_02_FULL_44_11]
MNKQELISKIAKDMEVSKSKANDMLNCTVEAIKGALKKGQRVQLIGFGTFLVRQRKARMGRNPKTGETIQIKARKVPAFSAGSELKKMLR